MFCRTEHLRVSALVGHPSGHQGPPREQPGPSIRRVAVEVLGERATESVARTASGPRDGARNPAPVPGLAGARREIINSMLTAVRETASGCRATGPAPVLKPAPQTPSPATWQRKSCLSPRDPRALNERPRHAVQKLSPSFIPVNSPAARYFPAETSPSKGSRSRGINGGDRGFAYFHYSTQNQVRLAKTLCSQRPFWRGRIDVSHVFTRVYE